MDQKPLTLTRMQAKEIDKLCMEKYKIPGIVLMENAGIGIVNYFLGLKPTGSIIICCGKGNNGGDGFVVARHLDNYGFSVHIFLFTDPSELAGDARINYEIALESQISLTVIEKDNFQNFTHALSVCTWVVDALFGTGLVGTIKPPYDLIINSINFSAKKVLSIDIPSGLDCDTGEPLGVAIKATSTVTMVGFKSGFNHLNAKQYTGHIHVVGIGAPRVLLNKFIV